MSGHKLPRGQSWRIGPPKWRLGDAPTTPTETRVEPRAAHRDRLRFRRRAFEMYARARGLDQEAAKKLWIDWRTRDRVDGRDEQRGGPSVG